MDTTSDDTRAWRLALWLVGALTILRLAVLFMTPLELYPDEAQYWLWSRTLDFGYFSKPPMIAWLIAGTTTLGNEEAFVRLAAPLLNALTALALFGVGQRLFGWKTGLVACLVYSLMPGVQLASGVISTDTPLLFFLSLALLAYVTLQAQRSLGAAIALGVALGLAMLSKYAAAYAIGGIVLHLVLSREAREPWNLTRAFAAMISFGLVLAPNLMWNARHDFATVEHTASNAHWASDIGGLPELGGFLLSQLGVFGPVPFVALIGGAIVLAFRRRLTKEEVLLLCWAAPPLLAVAAQAFISRANANWAASAYVAGSVLAAAWLVRWNARRWLIGGLGLQALAAALFLIWVAFPKTADAMGASNSFKRARGWEQTTRTIVERAKMEPGLTAVAVDDRFLFNAAAYYGRDYFGKEGPPLRMWVSSAHAQNQAEAEAPLTRELGGRVLAASLEGTYRERMAADFRNAWTVEIIRVRLDPERVRRVELMIGDGFEPKARQQSPSS
ncbi:MAG TPA: glycosyltransferase family 39 protein [Caulobacteraceae bacterium]